MLAVNNEPKDFLSMSISLDAGSLYPTVTGGAVVPGGTVTGSAVGIGNWSNTAWLEEYQRCFYPTYPYPVYTESKMGQAFKIAKVLQDKKLINVKTVKQFLDLIDELVKVL